MFEIPELGAIAVDLPLDRGAVRLMQPIDETGPVAKALATYGPHWWGFTVEVADARVALRHLRENDVAVIDRVEGRDRVLTVLPSDSGLPAVELVHRWAASRP